MCRFKGWAGLRTDLHFAARLSSLYKCKSALFNLHGHTLLVKHRRGLPLAGHLFLPHTTHILLGPHYDIPCCISCDELSVRPAPSCTCNGYRVCVQYLIVLDRLSSCLICISTAAFCHMQYLERHSALTMIFSSNVARQKRSPA